MPRPRQAIITVDARGLRCPLPVLRLAAAVRVAPQHRFFELLSDDLGVGAELAALAEERGWALAAVVAEDHATARHRVFIENNSQKAC